MNWETHRRNDVYGLVEFICEHGVGHPAYGSALWIAEALHSPDSEKVPDARDGFLAHGCCGCCRRDDFPGTPVASLKHAHSLIRGYLERIKALEAELAQCQSDLEEAHE